MPTIPLPPVPRFPTVHDMRTPFLTFCLIAGTLLSAVSFAATPKVDGAPAQIRKVLEARYPQVKILDVKPSPIAGLYEVFTGDAVAYASPNGEYLTTGPLIATAE